MVYLSDVASLLLLHGVCDDVMRTSFDFSTQTTSLFLVLYLVGSLGEGCWVCWWWGGFMRLVVAWCGLGLLF